MLHDLHKKDTESSPPSITSVGQNMPHYNLIMPFTKSPREFKNPKPSLGALISPFEMSYMSSTVIQWYFGQKRKHGGGWGGVGGGQKQMN